METLSLDATARTFRYLDPRRDRSQRRATAPAGAKMIAAVVFLVLPLLPRMAGCMSDGNEEGFNELGWTTVDQSRHAIPAPKEVCSTGICFPQILGPILFWDGRLT